MDRGKNYFKILKIYTKGNHYIKYILLSYRCQTSDLHIVLTKYFEQKYCADTGSFRSGRI